MNAALMDNMRTIWDEISDGREEYDFGANKVGYPPVLWTNSRINNKNIIVLENMKNKVSGEYGVKSEQATLTEDIIIKTEELAEGEDLRDQIAICTEIAEKTLQLLKIMRKTDKSDYRKNVVHLFFQAVKRNYARKKFNQKQIALLLKIIKASTKMLVTEEEYLQFDEQLYLNDLDVFPEME